VTYSKKVFRDALAVKRYGQGFFEENWDVNPKMEKSLALSITANPLPIFKFSGVQINYSTHWKITQLSLFLNRAILVYYLETAFLLSTLS
jgi:hypothetical protein